MTLNKFETGTFAETQDAKAYGAAIAQRVEHGQQAFAPSAKRAVALQPTSAAA